MIGVGEVASGGFRIGFILVVLELLVWMEGMLRMDR